MKSEMRLIKIIKLVESSQSLSHRRSPYTIEKLQYYGVQGIPNKLFGYFSVTESSLFH